MATYYSGINGSIHGKLGPVTGAHWKGIYYLRSLPIRRNRPPSEAQLAHRSKFKLVSQFVHCIRTILMQCYPQTPELTGINYAFSDIFRNAVKGAYPLFSLDYPKICISKGELHNAGNASVTATDNSQVVFSWDDNSHNVYANGTDRSVMVLYCPELQKAVYNLSGPERQAGEAVIVAGVFSGREVESWLTFISADRELAATSIYTGRFKV